MNDSIEAGITASESKLGGFLLDASTSDEKEEVRIGEEDDEFKDPIEEDEDIEMKDCTDEEVEEAKGW